MQTIKAIYDGVNFTPMQPIPVKGNYEVFITFIEPVTEKSALTKKKNRHAAFGCLKGKIHVPDNFNEPLEDFKEYM